MAGSNLRLIFAFQIEGTIAQLVEHRTENPGVPGSIPGGTTLLKWRSRRANSSRDFFLLAGLAGFDRLAGPVGFIGSLFGLP